MLRRSRKSRRVHFFSFPVSALSLFFSLSSHKQQLLTMDEFDDIVLDDYGFDAEPLPTPPPPPPADTNPAELTPTPDQAKKVQKIKFNESLYRI